MVCRDFILPEICKPCLFFIHFLICAIYHTLSADAINAINGVPVSADAKFLSEKWVRGKLTGEQMKQELLDLHRKIAEERSEDNC